MSSNIGLKPIFFNTRSIPRCLYFEPDASDNQKNYNKKFMMM